MDVSDNDMTIINMWLMQIVAAANEVIGSIDTEQLAKYLSLKSDPEDEGAEVSINMLPDFIYFSV